MMIRAAFAVMAVFLLVALAQFEAAPAASVSLFLVPVARTIFLGLLFVGGVAPCVDVYDQMRKLAALGEQRSFRASQVTQHKFAGFVSAGSAYLFSCVAIVFVKNMAKMGLFSLYCPEALFYQGIGLALLGVISNGLFLIGMQATQRENRLREEARQSWRNMA